MTFNSVVFACFLVVVLGLHRALPWRAGRVLLVVASYVFYGFLNPWYCLLLLASTLVDFLVAPAIARSEDDRRRKLLLAASVVVNLGLLAFFKYGDFALDNLNALLDWFGAGRVPLLELAVPVGISFYTFQTMSYTLDVYHGKVRPERDFVSFALYVAYFPQLMAGPIERAGSLLPQLSEKQPLAREDLELGFQRVLWGLVKKVVFADRLAVFVDAVYGKPEAADGLGLLLATCCFAMQIYLDFSGYTDIALGVARMMGIRLRENFDRPMLARNPVDFWSRWHISLTTWFRDYVFTALVGRKRRRPGPPRRLANLLVVLVLMGLWHGAGWHYLLMGLFAGCAIAAYEGIYLITGRPRSRPLFGAHPWSVPLAVALTSIHSLALALLFRAPTVEQALETARGIFVTPWVWQPHYTLFAALAGFVWLVCLARGLLPRDRLPLRLPAPLRAAFWCGLLLLIVHGAVDTTQQYIYFQF